eukprot:scaffold135736_cov28-Prasinocladus_malaysianus.AAC.1
MNMQTPLLAQLGHSCLICFGQCHDDSATKQDEKYHYEFLTEALPASPAVYKLFQASKICCS